MNENHTERLTPFDIARLLKVSITPYNATSNILECVDTIIHSKTKTGKDKHFAQLKQMLEEQDKSNITKDVISNLNEIEQIRRALILMRAMIGETNEKKDLQCLESLEEGIVNVATEAYRDFLNNTTVTNEKGDTFIASNCTEIERYQSFKNRILHIYNTYSFAYTMAFSQLKLDRNTQMLCNILKQATEMKKGVDEVKEGVDEVKEGMDEVRRKHKSTKAKQSKAGRKSYKGTRLQEDEAIKARQKKAFKLCYEVIQAKRQGEDYLLNGEPFTKQEALFKHVIEHYEELCGEKDKRTGKPLYKGVLKTAQGKTMKVSSFETSYYTYVRSQKRKERHHEEG